MNGEPIDHIKLKYMNIVYKMDTSPNVEIVFRWIRLGIKAKWEPIVQQALQLG